VDDVPINSIVANGLSAGDWFDYGTTDLLLLAKPACCYDRASSTLQVTVSAFYFGYAPRVYDLDPDRWTPQGSILAHNPRCERVAPVSEHERRGSRRGRSQPRLLSVARPEYFAADKCRPRGVDEHGVPRAKTAACPVWPTHAHGNSVQSAQ
jgi:hypothetical protein